MISINEIYGEYRLYSKKILIKIILSLLIGILVFATKFFIFPDYKFLFFIFLIFFIIFYFELLKFILLKYDISVLSKRVNRMTKEDKKELESIILYYKRHYIFTQNKIYLLKNYFSIKYEDIILIYTKYSIFPYFYGYDYNYIVKRLASDCYLFVVLKNGKTFKLPYNDINICYYLENNYSSLENLLVEKNEKILVGYTDENLKKIKEEYPAAFDRMKHYN